MTCARTSASTNPSNVPIHSPKIWTSFCTTSTAGIPGCEPDTRFGRIAPIIRPMTTRKKAAPIQSLYFQSVFIFSFGPGETPYSSWRTPINSIRGSGAVHR